MPREARCGDFLCDNSAYKLVVTLAETANADHVTNFMTAHFEAAGNADKATRFDASVPRGYAGDDYQADGAGRRRG
jgi:hypothetical protein